jgi:hypothetical protein
MKPISVRYSRSAAAAKSVVEIPLVHWVAGAVFLIPLALGTLGVLHPLDPSILLVLILRGIRRTLDGGHVLE